MKESDTIFINPDAVNNFGTCPAEACEECSYFKGAAYASRAEHGNI